jgi:hypothetical protein
MTSTFRNSAFGEVDQITRRAAHSDRFVGTGN